MATATLGEIVKEVRAEAGHALTPSQGINTLETIQRLIKKTEYELWVAFEWPELVIRANVPTAAGQFKYAYPDELGFDQIRGAFWSANGENWTPMEYGIPENCIKANGDNSATGSGAQFWEDSTPDALFRVWPTPNQGGFIRLRGMRPLNDMVDDTDECTLDAHLLALLVSSRLLMRAKADDAPAQEKAAQRHLQKLLANKVSQKHKVSTFGATRRSSSARLRPGIDYIA